MFMWGSVYKGSAVDKASTTLTPEEVGVTTLPAGSAGPGAGRYPESEFHFSASSRIKILRCPVPFQERPSQKPCPSTGHELGCRRTALPFQAAFACCSAC